MASILVVDDHKGMRESLKRALSAQKHQVDTATSGEKAVEKVRKSTYDLVISDLRMPGIDGLELLTRIKKTSISTTVIVMTAYGSIEKAVQAMREGAYDFVEKPFPLEAMEEKVQRALGRVRLLEENRYLKETVDAEWGSIVGSSPQIQNVLELIRKVASSPTPVLILGESGTGKELIAREIHRRSSRMEGPFVAVNCAALAGGLLESELFGHVRGAFTGAVNDKKGKFELAHGGTLFLDEIGEIDPAIQVKLLRFLQTQTFERVGGERSLQVDVRVLAATNRNLKDAIESGDFREDLYYRINVIAIEAPPLRERAGDIPVLASHFLDKFNQKLGKKLDISPTVLARLETYGWPGNVRELENVLERAVVLADGDTIEMQDLPNDISGRSDLLESLPPDASLTDRVDMFEKANILRALEENDWNQTQTAKSLKIKRSSLQYKMKKHELFARSDKDD